MTCGGDRSQFGSSSYLVFSVRLLSLSTSDRRLLPSFLSYVSNVVCVCVITIIITVLCICVKFISEGPSIHLEVFKNSLCLWLII
jgi:hypothetical protein